MISKTAIAAFAATLALCLPAKADIITVTTTGLVFNGEDLKGYFGLATPNAINGMSFTAQFTFDTARSPVEVISGSTYNGILGGDLWNDGTISPNVGSFITINGVTHSVDGAHSGQIYQETGRTLLYEAREHIAGAAPFFYSAISSLVDIPSGTGTFGKDFTPFDYDVPGSRSHGNFQFRLSDTSLAAYGTLVTQQVHLAVNDAVAVPGPIVGAGLPGLMLAALGMIGWRRGRPGS
jgi:hypothetical protein